MLRDLSDGELIQRYIDEQNQEAMRELVNRHHDRLYSRFLNELKNVADAKDLEQQLWLQVHRNLGSYKDDGRFAHYLSRIASNLLNDFWRQKGRRANVIADTQIRTSAQDDNAGSDDFLLNSFQDPSPDEEEKLISSELIEHLVTELIPQLPVEQRTAWLLQHESEHWETGKRLDWHHLAQLNGVDESTIWKTFESARNKLMVNALSNSSEQRSPLTGEETLVFVVWSQAQRLTKEQVFTWDYFAEILGVPTNTMKTRYRAAQKFLSEGLKARLEA